MPYDISIKKVALAGATGNLGSAILKELLESRLFEMTVLTREPGNHTFPAEVTVAKVDYTNLESLTEALLGQDALISAVASPVVSVQRLLIDAAVKAGVKRFIPSEFGNDTKNAETRKLPVYAAKVEIEEYLDTLAVKGAISYTLLYNGPFLDWGLRNGIFFNFKERKADIYDGGDQNFSTSRLSTVGKAVRRILTHPRETSDRAIRIKDIDVSQNQLLKLAQALTPGEEWQLTNVSTAELEKDAWAQVREGEVGPMTMLAFLARAVFAPEYGNKFERVHNSTLGITGMSEQDVEELVASIFGRKTQASCDGN
ncbi:NAD(P)-binding protein [Diplocarpon rosae]|nr:NAD(P)-binding protein [Diplocarpon rosae]